MLVTSAALVGERDVAAFAWSSLRVFRNVEHTTAAIIDAHQLPEKERSNAKKQARQIRQCLIQAEEYAHAAEVVTSATRPTLQYYSFVSLATAELLFKGTGEVSLDRAREEHGHHGLTLRVSQNGQGQVAAVDLVAKPAVFGKGGRMGTFELWHKNSRAHPVCGPTVRHLVQGGAVTHPMTVLMTSPDAALAQVPDAGVSLLQCMQHIPGLAGHLRNFGVEVMAARCHARREAFDANGSHTTSINIHPAPANLLAKIYERVSSDVPERLQQFEYPIGRRYLHTKMEGDQPGFHMPNGVSLGDEVFIWPYNDDEMALNYFGWLYVMAFVLGTYARYYPDMWMRDVEDASYVAVAADAFYRIAAAHGPLSTLSELSRTWMVPGK